jgi:hypothetical protein
MVLGLTVDGADVLAQGQPSLASETVTVASMGESTPPAHIICSAASHPKVFAFRDPSQTVRRPS